MKTQEELEHEADRQEREQEINAGVLMLEWPDDVTRHSGDGGEGIADFHRSLEESRDEGANTREGQAAIPYSVCSRHLNREPWCHDCWPDKGIWDEKTKTWLMPSGTVKQGRRPMFKAFEIQEDAERNRLQSKRDEEEKEWYENERSRAATADNEWDDDCWDEEDL